MGEEMVYIKKKILLLGIAVLVVAVFGIIIVKSEDKPCFTPVTNRRIVIDAGHGLPDEGDLLLHKENKQLTFYK